MSAPLVDLNRYGLPSQESPTVRAFTLYWSSLENFEACPRKFLWSRGWGSINVGGGPGKGKPYPVKKSEHHIIMGQVIQGAIERMYNDELWREPATLQDTLLKLVEKDLNLDLARKFVDWRQAPSREEMLTVCKEGVIGFLRTMKHNRLLGPYAKAEVELLGWVDKYNPVGGRADLIVRRDDTGTSILDGKNSGQKGKYTNPDQLRWYAMCYFLAFGKLPDKLGFVYYRFPHNAETGETGVDWVEFTKDDLQGLARRAVDARKAMDKEKFEPTPSPSTCKFCDFETVCDARLDQKKANARRPRNAQDVLDGAEGFVDLSFGIGGSESGSGG